MAVMTTIYCVHCKETKHEARSGHDMSSICLECKHKEEERKREAFLAERAALSIEERLTLIETWIYNYKPAFNPLKALF